MLLILIAGQLIAVAPAMLIPLGFNQPPAFEAVAHAQVGGVPGKQPAGLRVVDPDPGGPKDRREQGFGVTGRNVNNQIPNPSLGDRLQMPADGLQMHALDERRGWFQDVPGLGDKFIEPSAGFLRPQYPQLDFGLAQAGFPVVGVHRR